MSEWEDDEDDTEDDGESEIMSSSTDSPIDWAGEGGFDEEFDMAPRFLTAFSISPDADDLPPPFFPPSRDLTPSLGTFTSLAPDADDLPQPHFDFDSPVFTVSSPSSDWGVGSPPSLWSDTLESMMSPDPGDLPIPSFEVGVFEHLEDPDRRQDGVKQEDTLYHIGYWGIFSERFFQVEGGGCEGLNNRRWLDWTGTGSRGRA